MQTTGPFETRPEGPLLRVSRFISETHPEERALARVSKGPVHRLVVDEGANR
jgi:hypothetical protein